MAAKTIWKFPVPLKDTFKVEMPSDSEVLCVQLQDGQPTIWAVVDPSSPKVETPFIIHGTGHPISDEAGSYVGTFQLSNGLVFHLFEVIQ